MDTIPVVPVAAGRFSTRDAGMPEVAAGGSGNALEAET